MARVQTRVTRRAVTRHRLCKTDTWPPSLSLCVFVCVHMLIILSSRPQTYFSSGSPIRVLTAEREALVDLHTLIYCVPADIYEQGL